jgi:hypothetical protein
VRPVLDQVAGLGFDDGWVHGRMSFRSRSRGRHPRAPWYVFNEYLRVVSTLLPDSVSPSGMPVPRYVRGSPRLARYRRGRPGAAWHRLIRTVCGGSTRTRAL